MKLQVAKAVSGGDEKYMEKLEIINKKYWRWEKKVVDGVVVVKIDIEVFVWERD